MSQTLDLTGQRFGRLVAEEVVGRRHRERLWRCRCDCGSEKTVVAGGLRSGRTQSCGCMSAELASNRLITHGMNRTPLYRRWCLMISRVANPNIRQWADYGGRGITVCDRWREFENFAKDMGSTFSPELQLDRIDNDGPYSPENCRWATRTEQARNKRNNRRIEVNGVTLTLVEWSERLGIDQDNISNRLRRGWKVERALELQ